MRAPPADAYEPYLHRGLLRAARQFAYREVADPVAAAAVVEEVYTLFVTTPIPALAASAGAVLLALLGTALQPLLIRHVERTVAAGHAERGARSAERGRLRVIPRSALRVHPSAGRWAMPCRSPHFSARSAPLSPLGRRRAPPLSMPGL